MCCFYSAHACSCECWMQLWTLNVFYCRECGALYILHRELPGWTKITKILKTVTKDLDINDDKLHHHVLLWKFPLLAEFLVGKIQVRDRVEGSRCECPTGPFDEGVLWFELGLVCFSFSHDWSRVVCVGFGSVGGGGGAEQKIMHPALKPHKKIRTYENKGH